jgi:hypothetical protein
MNYIGGKVGKGGKLVADSNKDKDYVFRDFRGDIGEKFRNTPWFKSVTRMERPWAFGGSEAKAWERGVEFVKNLKRAKRLDILKPKSIKIENIFERGFLKSLMS